MPSIYTHYIAGEQLLKKLRPEIVELIESKRPVFDLGLQGPDFFAYFGVPYKEDTVVTRNNMLLHDRLINQWYHAVFHHTKAQSEEDQEILIPYMLGYLAHAAVDAVCHPYIMYKAGFPTANAENPQRFTKYHRLLETQLDILALEKYKAVTPSDFPAASLIWVSYAELTEICRIYPVNMKNVYAKEVDRGDVIKAYQDMHFKAKKRVRPGMTKILVKLFEGLKKIKGEYSSTIYEKVDMPADFANESNKEWLYPFDNRYPQTDSYFQLIEKGIDQAVEMVTAYYDGITGNITDYAALEKIGGASMYTGVPWNSAVVLKHYDCIFEQPADNK